MPLRSDRPGFALPMALLVVVFLTVGVATAFTQGQSELRADRDREAKSDAFAYAQSGLEQFAVNRVQMGFDGLNPAVTESTRVAMPNGHADVVMQRVRAKSPTNFGVYLIRSRGFRTGGAMAMQGSSTHTITQYAVFREGQMDVLSAWTSLSGLLKNGDEGVLTGVDYCGVETDVSGVAVPDAEYQQNGGAFPVPSGTPPINYLGDQQDANDAVTIDWDGIVNHDLLWPDVRLPSEPWPSWAGQPDWYPIIRIDAAYAEINPPMSGQGIIIATGDLTLKGDASWNGILLVGGVLTSAGQNVVRGAVISGLNEKLGITVPESSVGNGEKYFYYDSCEVAKALTSQAAMILLGKTWADNWPSY